VDVQEPHSHSRLQFRFLVLRVSNRPSELQFLAPPIDVMCEAGGCKKRVSGSRGLDVTGTTLIPPQSAPATTQPTISTISLQPYPAGAGSSSSDPPSSLPYTGPAWHGLPPSSQINHVPVLTGSAHHSNYSRLDRGINYTALSAQPTSTPSGQVVRPTGSQPSQLDLFAVNNDRY